MLQNEIVRNGQGTDVCHRIVKKAIPNVIGDDSKGFHEAETYCNQPVVLNISEGRKMCPNCEKQPPIGWVNPRVTNSAGIPLTNAELKQCGISEDTSLKITEPKKTAKKPKEKKAVEAKVNKVKKDFINIQMDISIIEQTEDVARMLIQAVKNDLDRLPVTNFAESKRLMKLQERLEKLLVI